jgi:hypothetical protein
MIMIGSHGGLRAVAMMTAAVAVEEMSAKSAFSFSVASGNMILINSNDFSVPNPIPFFLKNNMSAHLPHSQWK